MQVLLDRDAVKQALLETMAGFDNGDWDAYSKSLHPHLVWQTFAGVRWTQH